MNVILANFCRWSIIASLLLYVLVFGLVKLLDIPLKSDELSPEVTHRRGVQQNNILEYLHKLHKLNSNQGNVDYDRSSIQPFDRLQEVFRKADQNNDNYLDSEELSTWINVKIQEHIHKAITENYRLFISVDTHPKNGVISWEEYHIYYLKRQGINDSYIYNHDESHTGLSRSVKEDIMRYKAAWSECAKSNIHNLNLDEFLCFRHPESSYSTIISIVDEIYAKFDRNGDDILTEDEFSTLQEYNEYEISTSVHQEEKERRREFREMVDLNKDGQATRKELLTYIDPKNPRHAKEDADTLIAMADINKDGLLSLIEIFSKMDLFLGSKMIDTARSFHDEF